MKRLLLLLLPLVFILNSCQEDEEASAPQEVRFEPGVIGPESGRTKNEFPDNVSIDVTLTSNGETINENISIQRMGNSYISDPLTLKPGTYTLTDFKIVNESSEVLYATPKRGSKFAKIVSQPLPYIFSVSRNVVRNIPIEVIEVGTNQPEDFGYIAFNVGVVNPMQISVFAMINGKLELTSALAQIRRAGNYAVEYQYDLQAKVNLIPFKGETDAPYKLVITKEGYGVYEKEFVYDELITELDGHPLIVTLEESYTEPAITFLSEAVYFTMWMEFTGKGTIYIDWGNNEVEIHDFDVDPEEQTGTAYIYRDRDYTTGPIYPVRISGDLHLVVSMWLEQAISALDVAAAPNLSTLTVTNSTLETLDLTANTNLIQLQLINSSADNFTMPAEHHINYINLGRDDGTWPSETDLDAIVTNLYDNTVHFGIANGYFNTTATQVSAEAQGKMQELVDDYGWQVFFGGEGD